MKAIRLAIPEVVLLEPEIFKDDRGFFFESFSQTTFESLTGLSPVFVQDNHSLSRKGVLRGLHYQIDPHGQDKLVRVVAGSIFDVAVDIRQSSPTFGQWIGEVLDAASHRQLFIPRGFAHGFLALQDGTEVLYKTTKFYEPSANRVLRWDDSVVGIAWPSMDMLHSERDQTGDALIDVNARK